MRGATHKRAPTSNGALPLCRREWFMRSTTHLKEWHMVSNDELVTCKNCLATMARQVALALHPHTTCLACQGTGEQMAWQGGLGKGGHIQAKTCNVCQGTGFLASKDTT